MRSVHRGELFVSVGLLALGGYILFRARDIEAIRGYEQLGPRLVPGLVGVSFVILGGVLGWQVLSGGWRPVPEVEHAAPDWRAFGTIGAGLILHMALIARIGFVPASAMLVALVARGLGSRRWLRDVAIGLALAAAAFYLTTLVLRLHLPASPLEVI
jgi:putative tricarboxylic transport membrane protein